MSRTQVVAMEPGSRMPPAAARTLPPAPSCAKPARGRPPRRDQTVRNNILLLLGLTNNCGEQEIRTIFMLLFLYFGLTNFFIIYLMSIYVKLL